MRELNSCVFLVCGCIWLPQACGRWSTLYGDNYLGRQQRGLWALISPRLRQQSEPAARLHSCWWRSVTAGENTNESAVLSSARMSIQTQVFSPGETAGFLPAASLCSSYWRCSRWDGPQSKEIKLAWDSSCRIKCHPAHLSPPSEVFLSGQSGEEAGGRCVEIRAEVELIKKLH